MRLLLVKTVADSHPYSQFLKSLDRALKELGHESVISDQSIHVVDGAAPAYELARELQQSRYDALHSFSSFFGGVMLQNGNSLYDELGVKFVGWQLDHPIYTPQSLARGLLGRYSIYSNHNHLRFAQAIKLPGAGLAMLPGGEPLENPLKAFRSREWPIFVAATFNGEPTAVWEQLEDSSGKRLLMGVVDRLLRDREASLLEAFNETSRALGLGASLGADPAFDDQMIAFLREPLTYVRNADRISIIRSLAESGLPLTICGPGWRKFLGEQDNVTYLDHRVDFRDLPSLYNNSKIVLNLNAGNGACERAIDAAMAGAAVVSDYSRELGRQFRHNEIAFFDRARPADVVKTVKGLIEGDGGEGLAQRGHERVLNSALWRHRAEQMVGFLQGA